MLNSLRRAGAVMRLPGRTIQCANALRLDHVPVADAAARTSILVASWRRIPDSGCRSYSNAGAVRRAADPWNSPRFTSNTPPPAGTAGGPPHPLFPPGYRPVGSVPLPSDEEKKEQRGSWRHVLKYPVIGLFVGLSVGVAFLLYQLSSLYVPGVPLGALYKKMQGDFYLSSAELADSDDEFHSALASAEEAYKAALTELGVDTRPNVAGARAVHKFLARRLRTAQRKQRDLKEQQDSTGAQVVDPDAENAGLLDSKDAIPHGDSDADGDGSGAASKDKSAAAGGSSNSFQRLPLTHRSLYILALWNSLGELHREQGNYAAAEWDYFTLTGLFAAMFGTTSPLLISPLRNLALVYQDLHKLKDAQFLLESCAGLAYEALQRYQRDAQAHAKSQADPSGLAPSADDKPSSNNSSKQSGTSPSSTSSSSSANGRATGGSSPILSWVSEQEKQMALRILGKAAPASDAVSGGDDSTVLHQTAVLERVLLAGDADPVKITQESLAALCEDLSIVMREQRLWSEAVRYDQRTLHWVTLTDGPNSEAACMTLNALAADYFELGKRRESLLASRQALAMALGEPADATLITRSSRSGDNAAAGAQLVRVLDQHIASIRGASDVDAAVEPDPGRGGKVVLKSDPSADAAALLTDAVMSNPTLLCAVLYNSGRVLIDARDTVNGFAFLERALALAVQAAAEEATSGGAGVGSITSFVVGSSPSAQDDMGSMARMIASSLDHLRSKNGAPTAAALLPAPASVKKPATAADKKRAAPAAAGVSSKPPSSSSKGGGAAPAS